LIASVREAVGSRARILHVPGAVLPVLSSMLGLVLRDVVLTREEYQTMSQGMADSDAPSAGSISLSTWLAEHGEELGHHYANELQRHY